MKTSAVVTLQSEGQIPSLVRAITEDAELVNSDRILFYWLLYAYTANKYQPVPASLRGMLYGDVAVGGRGLAPVSLSSKSLWQSADRLTEKGYILKIPVESEDKRRVQHGYAITAG